MKETHLATWEKSQQHFGLLLRVREAATLLAMSERQVWVLLRQGQLHGVHPPGIRAIRIARDEVEALVASWRRRSVECNESAKAL